LADGPAGFPQDFTCPAVLRYPLGFAPLRLRGCHPLWPAFPCLFVSRCSCHVMGPTTPRVSLPWVWPGPRSLAATKGVSVLISFPLGTEMFHFPRLAPSCLCIQQAVPCLTARWVSPFGHLRITACERLPVAFRRCPRPSSPLIAKASTVRPL
jgi:hypothetical protein